MDAEAIYAFLNSPEWDHLCETFEQHQADANNLAACADEKDLNFRKGMIRVYSELLNLKSDMKAAMEDEDPFRADL